MKMIEELMQELPPELQEEVRDFAEFLLEKRVQRRKGIPSFEWAGALSDLRDQYTAVELQHKTTNWRLEEK